MHGKYYHQGWKERKIEVEIRATIIWIFTSLEDVRYCSYEDSIRICAVGQDDSGEAKHPPHLFLSLPLRAQKTFSCDLFGGGVNQLSSQLLGFSLKLRHLSEAPLGTRV